MSQPRKPTIMRFKLALEQPLDAFDIFFPNGHHVLNRTAWRGKEPRSCAVTSIRSGPHLATDKAPIVYDIEVAYRPKGHVTFVGDTKYDGWTAMMLDRSKDGTLLDGHGKALPPGQPAVYLPFEVYEDAEFNEMNFGEFINEVEVGAIEHITYDAVMQQIRSGGKFTGTIQSSFVAPRRQRPLAKIIVSELPLASARDSVGMRTIFIDKTAPHFAEMLFERLYEVASGFIEGRYSLKTISNEELEFVQISAAVMEMNQIAGEQQLRSTFDVFESYVSPDDMDELAKRLMAIYEVDVTVVDGAMGGLLMKRTSVEPH